MFGLLATSKTHGKEFSQAKLNKLGKKIVSTFLQPDSPRAVDIADVLRQAVLAMHETGNFTPAAFDGIRALLFKELKGTPPSRWLRPLSLTRCARAQTTFTLHSWTS